MAEWRTTGSTNNSVAAMLESHGNSLVSSPSNTSVFASFCYSDIVVFLYPVPAGSGHYFFSSVGQVFIENSLGDAEPFHNDGIS